MYHSGAGESDAAAAGPPDSSDSNTPKLQRRIVLSINAYGLNFVPDLESPYSGDKKLQSFPSRICHPWYFKAYPITTKSTDTKGASEHSDSDTSIAQRIQAIDLEKKQIRQLANIPEQSIRVSDGPDNPFSDSLDFGILDSLDLSRVPSVEETPWMLVDSVDKLKLCADELVYGVVPISDANKRVSKIHELAFDLEMDDISSGGSSRSSNAGIRTCLIQITSDVCTTVYDEKSGSSKDVYKNYVIDPLAPGVWDSILEYLGPIFANPKVVKIGHGIRGMDISSLHRDFGILVVNAFDTHEASGVVTPGKHGGMGLASLCKHYGLPGAEHYKDLKHKYQQSSWKRRPLDDGALEYGRYDIHYLVTLRKLLMRDLAKLDMLGSKLLRFGSSLDEDSEFDSALSGKVESSPMESNISSTTTSFSDQDNNKSENDSTEQPLPPQAIINASEFACYHHLMKAISVSQKCCLKLWTGEKDEPVLRNNCLLTIIKEAANQKGHGKHWTDANMLLYKHLAEWRASVAQREFNSASEVCSLDLLVYVAYKLPTNRSELRRYSYYLPVLLEDESLPYCDELCHLVTASDVYKLKGQSPSKEMNKMDAVFYSDIEGSDKTKDRNNRLFKLLAVSAVFGVIAVTFAKSRRR